ncbi:nucleoside diphosphate kinase 7-like [Sceloporus undulatus]|uniref:nucleoside diphosphate kinase 7-like n=1 Tax=Sceloporus undulatus TaxID=8520 RepID=UPI001C4D1983|nr:nucleoside diphosphate kinase 7-like [Sceloporus undulatus]
MAKCTSLYLGFLAWLYLEKESPVKSFVLTLNSDYSTLISPCSELLEFITSGPVVALEILGDEAISRWKNLLGPANSMVARTEAPNSIRALFGTDGIRNVAHGPDSFTSAAKELELFFPSNGGRGPASTVKYTHCTCCIIKPHAIKEGRKQTWKESPPKEATTIIPQ